MIGDVPLTPAERNRRRRKRRREQGEFAVSIYLEKDLVEAIDMLANEQNLSRDRVIALVLAKFFA